MCRQTTGGINFLWRLNLWRFATQHISNTKPNAVPRIAVVLRMKWGCVSDTVTYTAIYSCTLTLALSQIQISWQVCTHSWHEITPLCRHSAGTVLSILLSEGALSHSLERKPAEGKGNMMALAFSTWAKKRISPTFFFFFNRGTTRGSVKPAIPSLSQKYFYTQTNSISALSGIGCQWSQLIALIGVHTLDIQSPNILIVAL